MQAETSELEGILIFDPPIFRDSRGYFAEVWQAERYRAAGVRGPFVQDNISESRRHVIRGLHFQNPRPQGKLVCALEGEVFDVVVDIRRESPTFGQWSGWILSAANRRQLYIPPGFAHGFLTLSDRALFLYKCTDYYHPTGEWTLCWDDPDIGIEWPVAGPVLSEKDRAGTLLRDLPDAALF